MRKNSRAQLRRHTAVAACLALTLVVAGCGDDDEEGAGTTPTAATDGSSTEGTSTEATSTEATSTEQTPAPDGTTAGTSPEPVETSNVGEGETITVGGIFSETGAVPFTNSTAGAEAFWDNVNANGGINGYQINFIAIDDAFEAQRNAAAAQRLVDQGAVIMQQVAESTATAGLETVTAAGIPQVVGYSQPAWFQTPGVYPIGAFYQRSLARAVVGQAEAQGLTSFAITTVAAPTAEIAADEFRTEIDAAGLELVEDISFAPTDTDFTGQTAQVANSGAEIVICLCPQGAIGAWGQSAELQGYEGILFATGYDTDYKDQIGPWSNGRLWTAAPIAPLGNEEATGEAEAIGSELYPDADTSSINYAYAWTEAEVIAEAIRRVGEDEMTSENLNAALATFDEWQGTYNSPLTYTDGPNADPTQCLQLQVVDEEGNLAPVGDERFQCFEGSVAP